MIPHKHDAASRELVSMLDAIVIESERFINGDRDASTPPQRDFHRSRLKLAKAATTAIMRACEAKPGKGGKDAVSV